MYVFLNHRQVCDKPEPRGMKYVEHNDQAVVAWLFSWILRHQLDYEEDPQVKYNLLFDLDYNNIKFRL